MKRNLKAAREPSPSSTSRQKEESRSAIFLFQVQAEDTTCRGQELEADVRICVLPKVGKPESKGADCNKNDLSA